MVQFIQNNYKYVVTFIIVFILLWFLGICNNLGDPFYCYCFSHAIINGQIPYLDFNMIIPPLYIFYTSIGLLIWDNFNMFLLEQTLLVTITFSLLHNLYGKKCILFLLVTVMFLSINIIGTYNYMCFFWIITLIYLEQKYNNKDYLIGFIIGLSVLTKHTVGFFLVIPSIIFYRNDVKKIIKRFIGIIIPISIFVIYLIITKSLYSFIDLCILGLFDFAKENGIGAGKIKWSFLILSFILLIIMTIVAINNKKNISNYYLWFGLLFIIPIFDYYHFMMYFNCFLVMIIPYIKFRYNIIKVVSIVSSMFIFLFNSYQYMNTGVILLSREKHLEYTWMFKYSYQEHMTTNSFSKKFKNPIIFGYQYLFYQLINDKDLDDFSIINYGNFGYDGINKMKNKIDKIHNQIFIILKEEYDSSYLLKQYATELAKYIMDNSNKIDSKYGYEVYYKE